MDLWKRGTLENRVSQDENKLCKKSKLSAWPSHAWPTVYRLGKRRERAEEKKKCRCNVYVICKHQHKISNNFHFLLKKVKRGKPKAAQMSQWGIMHVIIRAAWIGEWGWGATTDTQDIELWWHLHRSAFQKTAPGPGHIWGTGINIHVDFRHTE